MNTEYNLNNLIGQYENYMVKDDDIRHSPEKNELCNKLSNIILVGGEKLSKQDKSILSAFAKKYSGDFADDQVIKTILAVNAMGHAMGLHKASDDVYLQAMSFKDVSEVKNFPVEDQKALIPFLVNRVMDKEASEGELIQALKIIIHLWDSNLTTHTKDKLFSHFALLMQPDNPANTALSDESKALITFLLKKYEMTTVAIPEAIKSLQGYHGEALDQGIASFTEMIEKEEGVEIPKLIDIINEYCKDHLKPRQYLIRNSSSQMNTGKGEFTATLSYCVPQRGIAHARFSYWRDEEGNQYWTLAKDAVPHSSFFRMLPALGIYRWYAVESPSKQKINSYLISKYGPSGS